MLNVVKHIFNRNFIF